MPERHQLTELQLAILRVVWDKGEATVQDIWEALHPERGLAQTTIATMLSRLERRGVVTRRAQARQYHYRAAVTEPEVQHSMVGELTERLFDGDVTALVQHLLQGEDVSPGDIAKIRELIERAETNAPEAK
ncbi:MAG TPA: BlaI/MecI/CopY family transcriptional regulator [Gemmatimonadales bacterium]|nr:BlaI/MecI/CopY family transcriptional regulator [Gemmatimonadales bacterium]